MRMKFKDYWVTIGLEIHVSLNTKQKLFSATPNSFNSSGEFELFDAGTPGILPKLNMESVHMAMAFGEATKSEIRKISYFDRKHYMYPDLPLGYQITQQHKPILWGGEVDILLEDGTTKTVIIEHSHLECDAAKSLHDIYNNYTAIDLSRCSAPLIEIVSTPCLHSPYEAKEYAKKVYALAVFMGICDGKIEEGSFRVDASISLNKDPVKLGTRVEIKNISSFSFLESAMFYEIERQSETLNAGKSLVMETRLFNEKTMETQSMRKKETVDEYRYLPCPDIPALILSEEDFSISRMLFDVNFFTYQKNLHKLFESVGILFDESLFSAYWKPFTDKVWKMVLSDEKYQSERAVRLLSFWVVEALTGKRDLTVEDFKVLYDSPLQAKEVKQALIDWESGKDMKDCLPSFLNESEIVGSISDTLKEFSEQVEKFKAGDAKIANFLVGKVMASLKGKAPAQFVKETVMKILES